MLPSQKLSLPCDSNHSVFQQAETPHTIKTRQTLLSAGRMKHSCKSTFLHGKTMQKVVKAHFKWLSFPHTRNPIDTFRISCFSHVHSISRDHHSNQRCQFSPLCVTENVFHNFLNKSDKRQRCALSSTIMW